MSSQSTGRFPFAFLPLDTAFPPDTRPTDLDVDGLRVTTLSLSSSDESTDVRDESESDEARFGADVELD